MKVFLRNCRLIEILRIIAKGRKDILGKRIVSVKFRRLERIRLFGGIGEKEIDDEEV